MTRLATHLVVHSPRGRGAVAPHEMGLDGRVEELVLQRRVVLGRGVALDQTVVRLVRVRGEQDVRTWNGISKV